MKTPQITAELRIGLLEAAELISNRGYQETGKSAAASKLTQRNHLGHSCEP